MSSESGITNKYKTLAGRSQHGKQRGEQKADWSSVDKALILYSSEIVRSIFEILS